MSDSPEQELVVAVATELAVDPSFVEKDWHATQLIATVAAVTPDDLQPVFSGGTSLSKGYRLIRRFSEDVDFKVATPANGIGRGARSSYRAAIVRAIRSQKRWTLRDRAILAGNENRFFRCDVEYSPNFAPSAPARARLRLEMTLHAPSLAPERRQLQSLIAEAQGQPPEIVGIACVTPAETAADKLSALTWRILFGKREAEAHDGNLVRHLHDLAALEQHAADHREFPRLVAELIEFDTRRADAGAADATLSPAESVAALVRVLATDRAFRTQYREFVAAMCYGTGDETPEYESAVGAVARLGRLLP